MYVRTYGYTYLFWCYYTGVVHVLNPVSTCESSLLHPWTILCTGVQAVAHNPPIRGATPPCSAHSLWPLVGSWGVGAVHTRNFGVIRSKGDGDLGVPNSRLVMLASISLQGITHSYSNI